MNTYREFTSITISVIKNRGKFDNEDKNLVISLLTKYLPPNDSTNIDINIETLEDGSAIIVIGSRKNPLYIDAVAYYPYNKKCDEGPDIVSKYYSCKEVISDFLNHLPKQWEYDIDEEDYESRDTVLNRCILEEMLDSAFDFDSFNE